MIKQTWATPALLGLIKTKSEAYKLYQKNKDSQEHKSYFNEVSNLVKKEIWKAKLLKYFNKLLDQNKRNPKN